MYPALRFVLHPSRFPQVVAQFNATALLTQRELVSRNIKQLLQERSREFNIILEVCDERELPLPSIT